MFTNLSLFSVSTFDPAKHLNTHPKLLDRTYNRPTKETLKQHITEYDAETLQVQDIKKKHQNF
jgi:hypothetical protein